MNYSLSSQLTEQFSNRKTVSIARSIFGTAAVAHISNLLNDYCQQSLFSPLLSCAFLYFSVGATFVVRLKNEQTVVLKAYGALHDFSAIAASLKIQKVLFESGFPCPAVLQLPQKIKGTVLTAQAYCDEGDRVRLPNPHIATAMATQLAQLIQQTQSYSQKDLPFWMALNNKLWHQPHNVLFDFEKTKDGAEWIDAIAHQSKQILRSATGPLVIGHSDWTLQNMSFARRAIACVYDWDSLRIGLEPCFVGGAARCYRHDWRYGPPNPAISVEEARQFIHAYEQARGKAFTLSERRTLGAALVYTAAYGTRCAYAGDRTTDPLKQHYERSKQQPHCFVNSFLI